MRLHIITIMMTLSTVSLCVFSQEAPETTEQIIDQNEAVEQVTEEVSAQEEPAEQAPAQDVPQENQSQEEMQSQEESSEIPALETQAVEPTAEQTAAPIVETEPTITLTPDMLPAEQVSVEGQEVIIPEETEEPVGIDTVSLENPQGNWLFKRIWWERAEERYEKIRLLADSIWESRTTFFMERNQLDRNVLNPFYITIGTDQGELQAILAEMNEFFEKKHSDNEDLTDQERALYEEYAQEEETLKQLQSDVQAIGVIDQEIDKALGTLMEQINRVRNYESQAWGNFKEIAHILNDTKARELYYTIEGSARNIKDISLYLERQFTPYFRELVKNITDKIQQVQNQMEALKEKGIRFQSQADFLEQKEQSSIDEDDEEDDDVQPKPKLSWFSWIGSLFSNALSSIISLIRLPYDMIFGK